MTPLHPSRWLLPLVALAVCALPACIPLPESNPSIAVSRDVAREDLDRMQADHRPLHRPVVILNGYAAAPVHIQFLAAALWDATSGDTNDILAISYPFSHNLDDLALQIVDQVDTRWPSADPAQTIEVDVVGFSLGGILARWAALPPDQRTRAGESAPDPAPKPTGKSLRIARLFTLDSPHRGSKLATAFPLTAIARDLAPGSPLLSTLDSLPPPSFEIIPYAQLGDDVVGATRSAPPGQDPIWSRGTLLFSHWSITDNPLIIADIARRLRDEPALLSPGPPPPRN